MRDETLAQAKRIVLKIGSSLIASRSTGLRPEQIERLADEISALRSGGREVLVVSSGAIMPARPPASMVMLQTVMRASMLIPRTVEPAYSSA